jgi:hypothetical protein
MPTTENLGGTQLASDQDVNKSSVLNSLTSLFDRAIAGFTAFANSDADITFDSDQGVRSAIKLTGTLTAARVLKIPASASNRKFIIWNATAGGFSVTVKTTAGGSTGVDITNGYCRAVWHDGTNVYAVGPEINPTTGLMLSPLPTFIAPTLLNSWVNYGGTVQNAGYALHLGLVRLRGTVKLGTVGSPIFTLPAGYRPGKAEAFAVVSNSLFGMLQVDPNGNVTLAVGSNVFVYLNCTFVPS